MFNSYGVGVEGAESKAIEITMIKMNFTEEQKAEFRKLVREEHARIMQEFFAKDAEKWNI